MYFVKTVGNLKHGESQHDRGSEAEEVRTHLVYELGEDVTVNIAANLGQEEPVAKTELPTALRHLTVLQLLTYRIWEMLKPFRKLKRLFEDAVLLLLSLPAPSCWISDLG